MPARKPVSTKTVDGMLKALLVLARAVDRVLEAGAVQTSIKGSLSSSKAQIIRLLSEHGRQTSSQVARFLGVSKPAVTQIVDAMVGSKLVVRRAAKEDRREVGLELTPRGKTVFQTLRRQQRHLLRAAIRDQREKSLIEWIDILQNVAGGLAQSDEAFRAFCLQCGAHGDRKCVLVGGDADCTFLQHQKLEARRAQRRKTAKH